MKKSTKLVSAVVVLAVLGGVYVGLNTYVSKEEKTESSEEESKTEPGRRKDGPCKSRNEIYPDHAPDLECDHYDHYVLFRKVHDLVIY